MDLEFDKEMDALLRRAVGGGVLAGDKPMDHLDADTIAAFAENALPVKSRTIYTQHLAACDPCRMSLANLISMNAAAEPAMAAAAAPVPAVSLPWYRKLFLAPNLAYVMGGLVLVFGGLLGVIVFQSTNNSGSATVSQLAETPETQSAPARAEAANAITSADTANTNSASNVSGEIPRSVGVAEAGEQPHDMGVLTDSAAPPPPAPAASGDTLGAAPAKDLNIDADKNKAVATQPAPVNAPKREDDAKEKKEVNLAAAEQENRKQDQILSGRAYNNQQQNNQMSNLGKTTPGPSRNAIQRDNRDYDDAKMRSRSESSAGARANESAGGVRHAGGKTFELKQGAWYDTAYSGQKTKNIRRSSEDYRKLDGGLRNIAESIGGTVVVLWNGKAYRIQ